MKKHIKCITGLLLSLSLTFGSSAGILAANRLPDTGGRALTFEEEEIYFKSLFDADPLDSSEDRWEFHMMTLSEKHGIWSARVFPEDIHSSWSNEDEIIFESSYYFNMTRESDGAVVWTCDEESFLEGNYYVGCIVLFFATNLTKNTQTKFYLNFSEYDVPTFLNWSTAAEFIDSIPRIHNTSEDVYVIPHQPSSWVKNEVTEAVEMGFVPKELQNYYTSSIFRGQFAEMAVQYIEMVLREKYGISGLDEYNQINPDFEVIHNHFTDCDEEYIDMSYSLGIINGYETGEFRPDNLITREEAAKMLTNVYKIYADLNLDEEKQPEFYGDFYEIGSWAYSSIYIMHELGVMQGVGNDRFSPKGLYTREQAIVTFLRLYKAGFSKAEAE